MTDEMRTASVTRTTDILVAKETKLTWHEMWKIDKVFIMKEGFIDKVSIMKEDFRKIDKVSSMKKNHGRSHDLSNPLR